MNVPAVGAVIKYVNMQTAVSIFVLKTKITRLATGSIVPHQHLNAQARTGQNIIWVTMRQNVQVVVFVTVVILVIIPVENKFTGNVAQTEIGVAGKANAVLIVISTVSNHKNEYW